MGIDAFIDASGHQADVGLGSDQIEPVECHHLGQGGHKVTDEGLLAVGAVHLLRDSTNPAVRITFSMAMWMAVIVAPIQILAGDFHGLNTLEHQPAKVMAMEGHYGNPP